jgi:chemotaxis receptor (MCP) glutamine deamidase CheD
MTSIAALPMERIVIGPGQSNLAEGQRARLVSYDIASCIAVAVYVPSRQVAGLLRFSFPDSHADVTTAEENPSLFGDLALPQFFAQLRAIGVPDSDMSVRLIGGAALPGDSDSFLVAKNNQLVARSFLWRSGLIAQGEDLGGTLPRSVWFESGDGRLIVRTGVRLAATNEATGKGTGSCPLAS